LKKILFITSTNIVSNPRLLKELCLAQQSGFDATLLKFDLGNWSQRFESEIIDKFSNVRIIEISALRTPFFPWIISVFLEKTSRILPFFLLNTSLLSFGVGRRSYLLLNSIKNINQQFDVVVAHNPQSFYPAIVASKKFKSLLFFDFEDFYSGEYKKESLQSKMISRLEHICISEVDQLTTASSAITDAYKSIFPQKSITTINNVFPLSYAVDMIKEVPATSLKLFWFSQKIGKNRGLENVIKAISSFKRREIQLTLLGSCTLQIKSYFSQLVESYGADKNFLVFMDPVKESQLVQLASEHHIGIASEISHIPNRDLCLTNKIFIYLLAGNALLLSNTRSQSKFYDENNNIGFLFKQDSPADLTEKLKYYLDDPFVLMEHRKNALALAKSKYNWDIEKKIFLDLLEKQFNS
jgi:glycosyltransferase involved in cell wall biosynthesis